MAETEILKETQALLDSTAGKYLGTVIILLLCVVVIVGFALSLTP